MLSQKSSRLSLRTFGIDLVNSRMRFSVSELRAERTLTKKRAFFLKFPLPHVFPMELLVPRVQQGHLPQSGHCAQLCSNQSHCGPISTFQAEGQRGRAAAQTFQLCKQLPVVGSADHHTLTLKSPRTRTQQHQEGTHTVDQGKQECLLRTRLLLGSSHIG